MQLPESGVASAETLIFGTVNGTIGVIASLPKHIFDFALKLQGVLQGVIGGVGGLSHAEWRAFCSDRKEAPARNFVDGDLIEAFLELRRPRMEEVSSAMQMPVDELCQRVEELARLH